MDLPKIDASFRRDVINHVRLQCRWRNDPIVISQVINHLETEIRSIVWEQMRDRPSDQRSLYSDDFVRALESLGKAEAQLAIEEALADGIIVPHDNSERMWKSVAPEDQPRNSLSSVRLSPWICIRDGSSDHCVMRVIEGTDPSVVANRVAFIEKTGRVLHNDEWVYLRKGSGGPGPDYEYQQIYGFDFETREDCDAYLRRFGAILPDVPVSETVFVEITPDAGTSP